MLCVCEWGKGKSVACAQKCAMHFPCRDKDCEKHTESALASWQLRLFLYSKGGQERGEREQVRQSVGRATKWIWIIQKMRLLFAKCAVNWDATRGKARGGAMKTSDDDEGNSSCDSRRKIMFYLWVAQLPLLLMPLSLLPRFHAALLFYPFAVRPLCWAQLKIGLNDNSQFAIFCKFSTAECVIYAADIADFF